MERRNLYGKGHARVAYARRHYADVSCAKMAEPIEMPFGLCGLLAQLKEACVTWDAQWRHLVNTTEKSMCGGDAAFLSNYVTVDHLFN